MAVNGLVIAFLLEICFVLQQVFYDLNWAMQERVAQGARYLREQVTRLVQGLEQAASAWAAPLLPALQQWSVLATVAVLVLLFSICCWIRRRNRQPPSSSTKDGVTKDKAHLEEKSSVALAGRSISAQRLLDLSESFIKVEGLVEDLLQICRKLSGNNFVPKLGPIVGVSSTLRGWSTCEEDAIYRLLVPLKPPRGHAFILETGTTSKNVPARKSSLRVKLRCTCTKEQLAGDALCILHHPQKELRAEQAPSLLGTLCTGPYLDVEKTARWLETLLSRAWALLPQSTHCRLKVLPSKTTCNLHLTDASGSTVLIEMAFGVRQGDSYVFLS